MTFTLHRSNRLEDLLDALAALGPPPDLEPFAPELFIVPSRGLERWLAMELSRHRGCFANARFLTLDDYLAELCDRALAPSPRPPLPHALQHRPDPWRPGRLLWPIAELLRELAPPAKTPPDLAPLAAWLANTQAADDPDALPHQLIELASRIADVFGRYSLYRSAMLDRWVDETSHDPDIPLAAVWQRALWRRLVARLGPDHPGHRLSALVTAARSGALQPLTEHRLVVFGHHTIAPLHLEALIALGEHLEVHLFRLVVSPTAPQAALPHPLQTSLGRLGEDLDALLDPWLPDLSVRDHFTAAAPTTLLSRLQRALFLGTPHDADLAPLGPADRSIQFHSCSSELRQVEVLRDELLAIFAASPDIEPRDVIVMTPDIETYAPLVDAVFRDGDPDLPDSDPRGAGFPPIHRIHDRSLRATNPIAESLVALLDLVGGRHPLPRLLDVMRLGPILARAGLTEEDLPEIESLLVQAKVRWGVDEHHRAAHGQPPLRRNTWRAGFDRLLLGHALASDGLSLWSGVLPVDQVEGKEVERLGLFIDYVERLFDELASLEAPRTLPEWRLAITRLVERLLVSDDTSAGLAQPIFDELTALTDRATAGGFSGHLTFAAIQSLLLPAFEARRPAISFLSGGLTFCSLLPMRAIPFKVVALLGMDGGTFPRSPHGLAFDLLEAAPARGDRTPRDDDRMTFLETLVSARRHLIITWTGFRATDTRELDAAGPVAELLETLRRGLTDDASAPLPPGLLVRHPLQPFTPSNFRAAAPLSFDLRYLAGASRLTRPRHPLPPHWPSQAPGRSRHELPELPDSLDLSDLALAISRPAEWFCQRRLKVRLGRFETTLPEREPLSLDALERWRLRDRLLRWETTQSPAHSLPFPPAVSLGPAPASAEASGARFDGATAPTASAAALRGPSLPFPSDRAQALLSSGDLPIGAAGDLALAELELAVRLITARVRRLATDTATTVPVDLELDGLTLTGAIAQVHALDTPHPRRVAWRSSRLKDADRVALWVEHLALTAALRRPVESHLVTHDGHLTLEPEGLSRARDLLRELLSLWVESHRDPLPFFARTAWALLDWLANAPRDPHTPPPEVRDAWRSRRSRFAGDCDADEDHVRLLFADRFVDPEFPFMNENFLKLAHGILAPLRARHRFEPLA